MNSVCMATYNGRLFIEEQVESILCQLAKEDELIVSDDGSTDATPELIRKRKDSRIRILEHPHFGNVVQNIQVALSSCRGDHIFLSDQDDIWMPDKMNKCLLGLASNSLVVTDAVMVDKNGNTLCDSFFALRPPYTGYFINLSRNGFVGACMAFHRCVLEMALPFPKKLPMHDWWLSLLAIRCFRVGIIREPLVRLRRHDHNYSCEINHSSYSFIRKILFRLVIGYNVERRILLKKNRSV